MQVNKGLQEKNYKSERKNLYDIIQVFLFTEKEGVFRS